MDFYSIRTRLIFHTHFHLVLITFTATLRCYTDGVYSYLNSITGILLGGEKTEQMNQMFEELCNKLFITTF